MYKIYNVIFFCIYFLRFSFVFLKMSSGYDFDDFGFLENLFGKISNESCIISFDFVKD